MNEAIIYFISNFFFIKYYQSTTMELPSHVKNNNKSLQEIMPFVQDICIALRTFIEIDANKQVTY
jgi:hypothetical protein